jgi:hypothetical protein
MSSKRACLLAALSAVLTPAAAGSNHPGLELDGDSWAALRAAVAESRYRVARGLDPGSFEAHNPAQRMHCGFSAEGVRVAEDVRSAAWSCTLALEAWGRGGALESLPAAEPAASGQRVEYERGPLTEWYVNAERGLEQGFTVESAPAGEGPLCLVLALAGGLRCEVLPGGRDARFTDGAGGPVLHYTGLRAWDAAGRELGAALVARGGRLEIQIDDRDATYPVYVDPWIATEEGKLVASDGAASDLFGGSVAVWGDTAVVGAEDDDLSVGNNAGSAYVFVRNGSTWSQQQKLTAGDAESSALFGVSVAIEGDTIVVGARNDNHAGGSDAGAAYVFVRSGTTWTQEQKLTASDAAAGDLFGCSVAISGETALIGARLDNNAGGANAGSAYVFVRSGTTWSEEQKLTASDADISDVFGWSVDLSDDTALVGAYGDDIASGVNAGAAYVFVRGGSLWSEQAKLVAGDPMPNDNFGWSVAVSGDTALVGAEADDHPVALMGAGSAYVFVRNASTWSQQQKLVSADPGAGDSLGYSVALEGDVAVVGTPFDDHAGGGTAGSALVFVRGGTIWCQQAVLTASDASSNDQFGWSVALSGDTAVAGANEDDPAGFTDAGSAYAFRIAPAASFCTAGTSASGCQATLSMAGTASASASSGFTLMAANVEGAKDGLFFFGTNGFQANAWGNGSSFQCIVPPVKRAGALAGTGTPGACNGAFAQDLNALWCPTCPSPSKNPGAMAVVQAQLWYRDPLSTSNQTTSFSDAIEFCVAP